VCSKIANFLKQRTLIKTEEEQKTFDLILKSLPALQVGLDVNCGFTKVDSFEHTEKSQVFELLDMRMLHGWLVDPKEPASILLAHDTYNDVTLKLAVLAQETPSTSKEETIDSEQELKRYSPEQGAVVQEFLHHTGHQLTQYGLTQLQQTIKEDELVVFFRNNHFSTLTKHGSHLFNLVTDIGYERERNVVWDLLATVHGDSIFHAGDFSSTDTVKKQEVLNTALAFGFQHDHVIEAIAACSKPNEELKTDDVLAWLQRLHPM